MIIIKKRKIHHIVLLKVPANNIVADQAINTSLGQYNCNIINFLTQANELTKNFYKNKLITLKIYIYENGDFYIKIKNIIFMSLVKNLILNKKENILYLKEITFLVFLKYRNLFFFSIIKKKNQKKLFKSLLFNFFSSIQSSNKNIKIKK